jgi:hypothetical protein
MASSDAKPVPIKNQAFRLTFGIFKNDGTLITGATGLDSEVSKDAGTFADCTSEATEIATASGVYYLDLTAAEMNADTVAVLVKSTSTGAVPVQITLYPAEAGDFNAMADDVLARDIGSGSNAGTLNERTVRSALRLLRNKSDVSAGTLTARKEDDSTSAWTAAVTTNAGANPIVSIDPA